MSLPPSARPRAIDSADRPVNVPTSTACRTPRARVRICRNGACSGRDLHVGAVAEGVAGLGDKVGDERIRRGTVRDDVGVEFVGDTDGFEGHDLQPSLPT